MRQFSATLEVPGSCDCCGNALAPLDTGMSRGKFRLEFTEPSEFTLGQGTKVTIGGGKLCVSLRQPRGVNRAWGLRRMYNTSAFARCKSDFIRDETQPDFGWYTFTFELPEFKPTYSTWWAELQFVEIVPFKQGFNGGPVECHNAASLRLKMETLD